MKAYIKDILISLIPNVKLIKRFITNTRIGRLRKRCACDSDIISAELGVISKKAVVDKYSKLWGFRLDSTMKMAQRILSDSPQFKDRTDKNSVYEDMIFCRIAYGFQPDEYLCFELENKSLAHRKEWISDIDRYAYIYAMNDIIDMQIFNNKSKTYRFFESYYARDAVSIKKRSDYSKFEKFVSAHTTFVKKEVYEGMGNSIELVDASREDIKNLFDTFISKGEHILEERIVQSNEMSTINESSVNTVRCITMYTTDGIVIPYTFLKVGRKGSFVDNGGAGGILAGIDTLTGVINTNGYDEFNMEYIEHPDSHIVFVGYSFPQWQEMIDICRKMALSIPTVRCIGWDMAHTDNGWIVVEGNGMTQFIGPQIIYKRGMKEELERIMGRMNH